MTKNKKSKNHIFCNNNKCKICFKKSFASQPKSKYWSKENNITPRQIRKSSGKNLNLIVNVVMTLKYL